ncbi:hypothetical protein [Synechococcus sp. BA-132 BA5]|uniref:hypothetical protein n=1 Tax=Synechococcus sp. BA-132 BA5 TaxID=3110252 RepID=UPI002B20C752|nr:hypothetical protein [Synechococcus sp. BA-132 BA5]MEA5416931.1 hypothetical protein [Synechococcus sp. BA-132 BA5]
MRKLIRSLGALSSFAALLVSGMEGSQPFPPTEPHAGSDDNLYTDRRLGGPDGDPVLVAFAAADSHLPDRNVHILDPEPERFHQPQSAALQHLRHKLFGSLEPLQHLPVEKEQGG